MIILQFPMRRTQYFPFFARRHRRRAKRGKRVFRGHPDFTKVGFFGTPLRGRMEGGNQGTPLKPRQGLHPCTLLPKNLPPVKTPRCPGREASRLPAPSAGGKNC